MDASLIASLGAPAALAVVLLRFLGGVWRANSAREEELRADQAQLRAEILRLTAQVVEAIGRNTDAMRYHARIMREVCEALRIRPCLEARRRRGDTPYVPTSPPDIPLPDEPPSDRQEKEA